MNINKDFWVFLEESIASEPLGVNAIVLRQVAREIKESTAQLATRSEVVPRVLPKILKGASQHLNVVLRSDQFIRMSSFGGRTGIDFTARTYCDLVYEG